MGSKLIVQQIESKKSIEDIKNAVIKAITPLGGQIAQVGNGLQLNQGKNNIQFSFAADFDAIINIAEMNPGKYSLNCNVNWKMNTASIVCLIVGFFVFGVLWIVPLLYLFIDPSQAYQNALMSTKAFLE